MQIQSRPITLLDIAKLAICGIYLNYYCINLLRGSLLPYGTAIFFGIAITCVFLSLLREGLSFGTEIICWIIYAVTSLIFSVFAIDSKSAVDGVGEFVQRLALIMMIVYICEKEKTVKFAIRLLAITAIACAASSLLMSESISTKLTLTSGATISTNDIGALMAFGCFAVLFAFGLKEHKSFIKTTIKIAYIISAVSVIFIAGSRKSILAIFILFALLFLFCGRDLFKNMSTTQFVLVTILIIGAVVFVYYFLLPNVENTDMYQSVFGRRAEQKAESDEARINLYSDALNDFVHHPLFGLGYNNFVKVHFMYSHSTYVEPLACSGLFGLFYLAPYVMILVKQCRLIKLNKSIPEERLWQKELLVFYISFLFIGVGIPFMYKDIPCIILAMFIASQRISFERIKEAELNFASEGDNRESITYQSLTSYS